MKNPIRAFVLKHISFRILKNGKIRSSYRNENQIFHIPYGIMKF
jgi:hypothetical protein